MSTTTKRPRLSVATYDRMVEAGILPETNRFELINGKLVEKVTKGEKHSASSERTWRAIHALLPAGWHVRIEKPVSIPRRRGEPEPDVSVARGGVDDYEDRHPGPADVALVVEVTRAERGQGPGSGPHLRRRRRPRVLDREHPRPPARSLRPPDRRRVPGAHDPGRDGVGRARDRRPGRRHDRRGQPAAALAGGRWFAMKRPPSQRPERQPGPMHTYIVGQPYDPRRGCLARGR